MRSRITVDLDFDNQNEPCIKIRCSKDLEDLRDKTLKAFIEILSGDSRWLRIGCVGDFGGDFTERYSEWKVTAIPPQDLLLEADRMKSSYRDIDRRLPSSNLTTAVPPFDHSALATISKTAVCYSEEQLSELTQEQRNKAYNIMLLKSDGTVTFTKITKEKINLPGMLYVSVREETVSPQKDPLANKCGPSKNNPPGMEMFR